MTVDELLEKLNKISKLGFGKHDVCIALRNTAHHIDDIRLPVDADADAKVIVMYRKIRPGYYLDNRRTTIMDE